MGRITVFAATPSYDTGHYFLGLAIFGSSIGSLMAKMSRAALHYVMGRASRFAPH